MPPRARDTLAGVARQILAPVERARASFRAFQMLYSRSSDVRGATSLLAHLDDLSHFQNTLADEGALPVGHALPTERQLIQRVATEIQEEEDRAFLRALEVGRFMEPSYVMTPAASGARFPREVSPRPLHELSMGVPVRADAPVGWTVQETVGVGVVNPRAVRRVQIPEFEIASSPTIPLDAIRQRRFDVVDRGGLGVDTIALFWERIVASRFAPKPSEEPQAPSGELDI